MPQIPFIDLAAQQARIRTDIDRRIAEVLDRGDYILGQAVRELEEKLCGFTGSRYCVTCASGSDALLMTLMAWGLKKGDAVFVPPFTFFASAEMPALLGATPIFVDIDERTFLMRPDALEKAVAKVLAEGKLNPAAVLPVDLFGQPADYTLLLPIAQKYNLPVLEDAAQSFGSSQHGRKACALGATAAVTSFFPAKPLGCYGDGGAIFTDDARLAEILRSIRVHGKGADKYDNVRLGINGRLDTLQAAILLAKIEIFSDELQKRNMVAKLYHEALANIPDVLLPVVMPESTSVWAQYCILLPADRRRQVIDRLSSHGIPSNIYYPKPLHLLQAFSYLGHKPEDFPAATAASRQILALPFHPYLEESAIAHVADILRETLQ